MSTFTQQALADLRSSIQQNPDLLNRGGTSNTDDEDDISDKEESHEEAYKRVCKLPLNKVIYLENIRLSSTCANLKYKIAKLETEIDDMERKYTQIRANLNNLEIDHESASKCIKTSVHRARLLAAATLTTGMTSLLCIAVLIS